MIAVKCKWSFFDRPFHKTCRIQFVYLSGKTTHIMLTPTNLDAFPSALTIRPKFCTYSGGFELVDDGSFATVVQSQTQDIDLFLP